MIKSIVFATAVLASDAASPTILRAQTTEALQPAHGLTRTKNDLPNSALVSDPIAALRKEVRPSVSSLPVPSGFTRAQLSLGDRVFHGEAGHGQCSSCHGIDAAGGPRGTDLKSGLYAWSDGSVAGIKHVMMHNMAIAPGMDGALTPEDVDAVAAYVWAIGRKTQSGR